MRATKPKRVAVVLSGSGVHDGSEIHESVLVLLGLERAKVQVICTAPNVAQPHVVDHFKGEINVYDTRNVLAESARIARGVITPLDKLSANDVDACVFPGGYGAAKTLSNYAMAARDCKVLPDVERLVTQLHTQKKPQLFLCTATIIAARVLGKKKVTLTIGNDATLAQDVESWGVVHQSCDVHSVVVDRENKIVSSPAYMLTQKITDVADGIDRAVRAMLELV